MNQNIAANDPLLRLLTVPQRAIGFGEFATDPLLGERFVAFRDSDGRVGVLDELKGTVAPPQTVLSIIAGARIETDARYGLATLVFEAQDADYRLAGWSKSLIVITAAHRILHIMVMCAVLGSVRLLT